MAGREDLMADRMGAKWYQELYRQLIGGLGIACLEFEVYSIRKMAS